ncbi:SCO family protein [Neotabrizicola sp. VNH66]|uniref:SCO family protein n=1 Tax=Neotabrizicola sp. VNH66 TaxID=3400918 RepID=UPI003C084280
MRRRRLILGLGAVLAAVSGTLVLGAWRSRAAQPALILPLPLTEMSWQLTNHRGQSVTPSDWAGRPVMAFFGFTFCPDVCPTTLNDISDWLEALGPEAAPLVVALITVDPDRDGPQELADYLSNFDARITGLTGSAEEIARTAADFRVRYEKVARDDGDYTMNHTAGIFLFRPDGRFVSIIDFHDDRRFAVPKIRRALG